MVKAGAERTATTDATCACFVEERSGLGQHLPIEILSDAGKGVLGYTGGRGSDHSRDSPVAVPAFCQSGVSSISLRCRHETQRPFLPPIDKAGWSTTYSLNDISPQMGSLRRGYMSLRSIETAG